MVYTYENTKTLAGGEKVTYLYLAHNIRKNNVTVKEWVIPLGRKESALKLLKEIALHQKKLLPDNSEHQSSALILAYLDIFQELGLVELVNALTHKTRAQGLSPGQYLLFCVLNRLTEPKSEKQLQDWFKTTILSDIYPDAAQYLTSQHLWNHFAYFDEKNMQDLFFELLHVVEQIYGQSEGAFLFDATNFYTYISDHSENELPKRGHNKENRKHLNQINFSLAIDQYLQFPLYYKIYPGNVPDSQHFKDILPEISEWFHRLRPTQKIVPITLVFDKGNNSPDAIDAIEQLNWGFVGSLRPSMFKSLLQEPFTEFSKIYDTKSHHAVYAFRREISVYSNRVYSVIVTFDEKVHNKKLHTLEYHIAKRFDQLKEFSILKLNTKAQWKDPKKISKHIDTQILKQADFKKFIEIVCENTINAAITYQTLRWGLKASELSKETNTYGKAIIFSNRVNWTTKDIVLGYRQQFKVEHKFRDMKSVEYIRVRPIFHWRDHNIRVHIYICLLALLGQALLKLKFKQQKISGSFLELTAALKNIHKINLIYNNGKYKKSIPPQLTKIQSNLMDKLQLTHYFE